MGEARYIGFLLAGLLALIIIPLSSAACSGGVRICGQNFPCGTDDGVCPTDYGLSSCGSGCYDADCGTECTPGTTCCEPDGSYTPYGSGSGCGSTGCISGDYYYSRYCDGSGSCVGNVREPDSYSYACSCAGGSWISALSECCGDDGSSDDFSISTSSTCSYCRDGNTYSNSCASGTSSCYDDGYVSGTTCYYNEYCGSTYYTAPSTATCLSSGCNTDGLVSGESCLINEACTGSGRSITTVNCDSYDDASGSTWAESEVTSSSCTSSCSGSGCCDVQSATCDGTTQCGYFHSYITNEENVPNARCYRANSNYWTWGTPASESNCNDGFDNDCDGTCDYDSTDCGAADSSCTVSVTGISSPSQICPAETFEIDCSVSVAGINSVTARIDGVGSCSFVPGSWSGTTASFSCTAPATLGTYTVRCSIDGTKSYQSGSDRTRSLSVGGSGCCSQYTASGEGACEGDAGCDWCPECDGNTRYSGGTDRCVTRGTCSYQCNDAKCGAACDADTSFASEACTDYCVTAQNRAYDYTPNSIRDECNPLTCSVIDNTCASDSTLTSSDCGSTQCSVYYAGLHVASGSCLNGCSGATCGSCVPDLDTDCTCAAGWTNADGIASNGCELACSPTNGGVEIFDCRDNDCNGLVDDGVSPGPSDNDVGVCSGSTQACSGSTLVYSYELDPDYQSTESRCDSLDNDCDGVVDENTAGDCYALPMCAGTLDCAAYYQSEGSCPAGCLLQGRCSDDYRYCDRDSDCNSGVCSFTSSSCSGMVSCSSFSEGSCSSYAGFGCSLSGSANYADSTSCVDNGFTWSCSGIPSYEVCSDNIDNNAGGGVDCLDSSCRLSVYAVSSVDRYNCLGTDQDGSSVAAAYCAIAPNDPTVGLCCPAGEVLSFDGSTYRCVAGPSECAPTGSCSTPYSAGTLETWYETIPGCTDPVVPDACCPVTAAGQTGNYVADSNVRVWG